MRQKIRKGIAGYSMDKKQPTKSRSLLYDGYRN